MVTTVASNHLQPLASIKRESIDCRLCDYIASSANELTIHLNGTHADWISRLFFETYRDRDLRR